MIDYLINLDSDALLWLNSFHTPLLDRFMMLFTGRFMWIPMYATILYILCRMMKPRQVVIFTVAIALAIALSDQTVASVLRPIFHRLRPANLDNPLSEFVTVVDGYRGGRYGFPSCHGANSFALATFLCLLIRRPRFVIFILAWAALNCYTRNYLGVHYPGDIIVGAAIGSVFGALCFTLARRVARLSPERLSEAASTPLFPYQSTPLSRLKDYDTMIITGLVTTAVILIISIIKIY